MSGEQNRNPFSAGMAGALQPSQQQGNIPASSLPQTPFHTPEIHTMPGRYLGPSTQKKGSRNPKPMTSYIIIGVLGLLVVVGGVVLYIRLSSAMKQNQTNTSLNTNSVNTNTAINTNNNTNAANSNVNATNANTNTAEPLSVTGSLLDAETNEVLGSLTATVPAGALPSTVQKVSVVALAPTIGAYATAKSYAAVGGVYLLTTTPPNGKLSRSVSLELTYTDRALLNLDMVVKEDTLKAAHWNGTDWTVIDGSTVNKATNTVTVDVPEFYTDGIAIVAPKPVITNTNTSNTNVNGTPVVITSSTDSDSDGLTDQEELLYGTNPNNADTDGDGYKDGQEVLAGYDPTRGSGAKLAQSSLVKTYTNTTYHYSILYPASWVMGTMNADALVLFTSITGEFIQISVQDNPSGVSARQWYITQNPSVSPSSLRDTAVGALAGVIGPDNLNIYLADTKLIYQITYNIGIKTTANYMTTFSMMFTNFQTGVSAPITTNSNINRNFNSNSNLNTNSNTNRNTNANSNSNTNS